MVSEINYRLMEDSPKAIQTIRPADIGLNDFRPFGNNWHITLFHYRNHGAAFGRVLIGIQNKDEVKSKFESGLNELGFNYKNETRSNPAYQLFLGGQTK